MNHSFVPTSPVDAAREASKRAPQEVQPGYDFECNYTHGCELFVVLVMERRKKKSDTSLCNILIELEESIFIELPSVLNSYIKKHMEGDTNSLESISIAFIGKKCPV